MKNLKFIIPALIMLFGSVNMANAQSIGDLLNKLGNAASQTGKGSSGSESGNTITNLLEGLFSSSNLTVADLTGNWKSTGPAVCFQGDNFLKKAGGAAAAAAIESKMAPYYKQFGLTGAKLAIKDDGTFKLTVKGVTLSGTITEAKNSEKGIFNFNFTAMGSIKIGSVKTYVQKTSGSMDVMFDATKMISIISAVSKATNISTLKTLDSLLSQYDGLCLGFKLSAI